MSIGFLIPLDVIRYIIEYIDDIDIRRSFDVYSKINIKPYRTQITGLCKKITPHSNTHYEWTLYNLHTFDSRTINHIGDDILYVEIKILYDRVDYEVWIYKLKLQPVAEVTESNTFVANGDFEEYQWKVCFYLFTIK